MASDFQGLADGADRPVCRAARVASTEQQIRTETIEETPLPLAGGAARAEDQSGRTRAEDADRIEELEALAKSLEQRLTEAEGRMAEHAYRVLTARLQRQQFADAAADAKAAFEAARGEVEAAHAAVRAAQAKAEADRNALLKALAETSSAKADLEAECSRLKNRSWHQEQALKAILASRSWRALEPVRKLTTFARRVFSSVRARRSAAAKVPAPLVRIRPGAIVQWIRRDILRRAA